MEFAIVHLPGAIFPLENYVDGVRMFGNKNDTEEWIIVFKTDKPYEAEIIKGLLNDYGVEAHLLSTGHERDMLHPVMKLFEPEPDEHYHIYVKKEEKQAAQDIINAPPEEYEPENEKD